MASLEVKGPFPHTPHRLIEVLSTQLGLLYGDFVGEYLRTRRYSLTTGKGCMERVIPGSRVPQGALEGPFLYMLTLVRLMRWIAQDYPHRAGTPHTLPA